MAVVGEINRRSTRADQKDHVADRGLVDLQFLQFAWKP